MRWMSAHLFLCLGIAGAGSGDAEQHRSQPLRITITYDNIAATKETREDWGFACLIEGGEKTILFDTGTDPRVLHHNFDVLTIEPESIDVIFLSHNHRDHTGGLSSVLEKNSRVVVYMPASFPQAFVDAVRKSSATPVRVSGPTEIAPGMRSTGEMGREIPEQALVIDTRDGLVVISGCAHPGIADMVRKAKESTGKNVYLVMGGFHLLPASDDEVRSVIETFRKLGVAKVGPGHCTGERARALFREAYGDDYLELGTGRVLTVSGM